jgi:hypothetical protein
MPPVLSFDEAVEQSDRPHVLLGNGFSRACREDIFAYSALKDRASLEGLSESAREAFELLETDDFEAVMRALRQAARIVELYSSGAEDISTRMAEDAVALRELLIETIAASHPDHPFEIEEEEYRACREFLGHFNRIYSLNYDLLLYWACMQDIEPPVSSDDGFRTPDSGEAEYVTWDPDTVGSQSIYYLHGALHIFDAGSELQKFTWVNTGIRLIRQVRDAMEDGKFPHFVAEGTSRDKLSKIRHSAYLSRGERSLYKIRGDLFLFGFSMGESDAHILRAIRKNRVDRMFVGLYGDPESDQNQNIVSRAEQLRDTREYPDLELLYYDVESAHPWG